MRRQLRALLPSFLQHRGWLPGKKNLPQTRAWRTESFFCNIYPCKINISTSVRTQTVPTDSFPGPSEPPVTPGAGNRVTGQPVLFHFHWVSCSWRRGCQVTCLGGCSQGWEGTGSSECDPGGTPNPREQTGASHTRVWSNVAAPWSQPADSLPCFPYGSFLPISSCSEGWITCLG